MDLSDPQKDRVYEMEEEELGAHCRHKVKMVTLRKWAKMVCKHFDVPLTPVLARVNVGFGAAYTPSTGLVELDPGCGRNGLSLAHELAHHVTYLKHPRSQDHGPTWVYYYGEILAMLQLVPVAGWKAICRKHKVRLAVPTKVPTPVS